MHQWVVWLEAMCIITYLVGSPKDMFEAYTPVNDSSVEEILNKQLNTRKGKNNHHRCEINVISKLG